MSSLEVSEFIKNQILEISIKENIPISQAIGELLLIKEQYLEYSRRKEKALKLIEDKIGKTNDTDFLLYLAKVIKGEDLLFDLIAENETMEAKANE